MALFPLALLGAGIYNLYDAFKIFTSYQSDKEIWIMLDNLGLFEDLSLYESRKLFYGI
jgi:hypothetical protein